MNCKLCKSAPPIKESHVVPRFMGKYIKKNSPFGNMLNLWSRKPEYDLHKGPYFCAKCDNEIISGWENYFSKNVWGKPFISGNQWTQPESLNFILSLAYRYAIHFVETSPIPKNRLYSECVRIKTESAIRDHSHIGKNIFIYPYVHQEISTNCSLLPGVNHLLSLAVHGESLPQEEDLPNAFLVLAPKMTFLFCDADLVNSLANEISKPVHLLPGKPFDPISSNIDMPNFLSSIFNRLVNHGQTHQKQLGRWKKMAYGADKLLNPDKMCYVAQSQDQTLLNWKRIHCR